MQRVQDDLRPVLAAERLLDALTSERLHVTDNAAGQPDEGDHDHRDHDAAPAPALHTPQVRVDLDRLARRLGITVATFHPSLRPTTSGYLEPGENLIFLQTGLSAPVRRFTLAHELGHAALHRAWGLAAALARGEALPDAQHVAPTSGAPLAEECAGGDFDAPLEGADTQDELLRPGQAYSAAARREQEANLFAAALLAPADAVLQAYQRLANGLHNAQPRQGATKRPVSADMRALARQFGVSEDVILRRLTELLVSLPNERQVRRSLVVPSAPAAATESAAWGAPHLDDEQLRAARAPTPALVIAGPGAGKTSALL
ncbi:MAG TPA: ImmA/IrrE family metallo-endopeptidase, partial [Ktedonobacterales bacterium]|nr:ImmA/IrrE family metallo-endopeptidase [Ktedonobacterales bacterium]